MSNSSSRVLKIPVIDANSENIKPFGYLLGDNVSKPGLEIPFYQGRVIEGENLDFIYRGTATFRTAKIMPGYPAIIWLERHMHMTQLFVGLGKAPFIMVMAPPNHEQGENLPDLNQVKALRFPAGHALLLHLGTWHDFPIACEQPVVILTANSDEVVIALSQIKQPGEMNQGDVYKVSLPMRLGYEIQLDVINQ
ncbi:ureidoglycolate lyase [Chlorogloeopsis sp. ULAP01]|uniref:ureidoglycolate lyase n=1 Tax=Chlorogloeopsis sp. ULAP01 TaxID=3056483 RepID=UPI0025AABAD7|nr:ureidoglycolate lyase [Chlorogloeopsis sp. ULAP01]MDM9385147.1 ureidoglycolate lyase [Chlorogloeopsis sp. ULAP01]